MARYVIVGKDGRFWNGAYWVKEFPQAEEYTNWQTCRRDADQASSTQPVEVIRDYGNQDEQILYRAGVNRG